MPNKDIDIDFLKKYESEHLDAEIPIDKHVYIDHKNDSRSLLINGLTTFYRSCSDLAELFNLASVEDRKDLTLKKIIIGTLFEVRASIDDWVAQRVRSYYSELGKDPGYVLSKGKPVRSEVEKHRQAMKIIRDRVFHKSEWIDEEVINQITNKMFQAKIPGRLHIMLTIYGINTVSAMLKDDIGIPGIGCFGVIPIPGKDNSKVNLPLGHPHIPEDMWPK